MKSNSGSILGFIIIAVTFLTVVTVCTLGPFDKKTTSANTGIETVVATDLGWVKIISQPILIVTTKGNSTGFKQVKFDASNGQTQVAMFSQYSGVCWYANWKVGDEIFVVSIPGRPGDAPTIIAMNHRSQKPEIPYPR